MPLLLFLHWCRCSCFVSSASVGIRKTHLRTEATELQAKKIYDKIQQGVFDVANEQNGCVRNALYVVLRCSTANIGKTAHLYSSTCAVSRWESTPGVVARPGARATARTRAAAANACGSCLLPLCCMSNENSVSLVAADPIPPSLQANALCFVHEDPMPHRAEGFALSRR